MNETRNDRSNDETTRHSVRCGTTLLCGTNTTNESIVEVKYLKYKVKTGTSLKQDLELLCD